MCDLFVLGLINPSVHFFAVPLHVMGNLAYMRRTCNPLIKRPQAGTQTSEMPCATATFWGFFLVKKIPP